MNKLILLLLLTVFVVSGFVAGYKVLFEAEFYDTHTSAVCSANICQDYIFTCLNGEVIDSTPIGSFTIFDQDWVDLRENKQKC